MIDGISGSAFSATTLPPIDLTKTVGNAEKVIKVTHERYGTKREIVEASLQLLVQIKQQEQIRKARGKLKWSGDLESARLDK